jgi:hypothetical protein
MTKMDIMIMIIYYTSQEISLLETRVACSHYRAPIFFIVKS